MAGRERAGMAERRETSAAVALLRCVQAQPGISRAAVARTLGLPSGFAAETVARLVALRLLQEGPAVASGARGRPTSSLLPHPEGPLVLVAALAQETWQLAAVELGGERLLLEGAPHRRQAAEVLGAVAARLATARRRLGARVRAVAVSAPGTVAGTVLTQASGLGWHDLELASLWPADRSGRPLVVGNDATFAAVAEARRGSATGATTSVHLYMGAGIGGAVLERGRLLAGSRGMAGEFGHLPFGERHRRCGCGAAGCWNTSLDPAALAGALGREVPEEGVTFFRATLAAASGGAREELAALALLASSLGRGAAGLANALDPDLVTVGGLGRELLATAGEAAQAAYLEGLMRRRRDPPPPLVAATLGDEAPLVGAAEQAFATVLSDEGLAAWAERSPRARQRAGLPGSAGDSLRRSAGR